MLKDTTREVEIEVVELLKPELLQFLAPKKKRAFARIRTLHGLLKVALDDFEAVLAEPGVTINMDEWVRPRRKGVGCSVCLAGSVMYRQYGIRSHTTEWDMGQVYGDAVEDRLNALNELRIGGVMGAWYFLNGDGYRLGEDRVLRKQRETSHVQERWRMRLHKFTYSPSGRMNPAVAREFLGEMRVLQKDLKTAGL